MGTSAAMARIQDSTLTSEGSKNSKIASICLNFSVLTKSCYYLDKENEKERKRENNESVGLENK